MTYAKSLVCGLIVALGAASAVAGPMVYGYYPGYRYREMPPAEIPLEIVDCVLHFSAVPRRDGTLDTSRFGLSPARMREMVELAPCATLTIGGGGVSGGFKTAPTATLAANIAALVTEYGYDGVDIDWEPIEAASAPRYRALIRELARRLPPAKTLSIAVGYPYPTKKSRHLPALIASVSGEVDLVHLMAYGISSPAPGWSSWHSSALGNRGQRMPGTKLPLPCAEEMVRVYAAAGVPKRKMTLGLALFGHEWDGVGGLLEPAEDARRSGEIQYREIVTDPEYRYPRFFDSIGQVPYRAQDISGARRFLSFEDATSLRSKVAWARAQRLAGVMVWEVSGDYRPGARQEHPLLAVMR